MITRAALAISAILLSFPVVAQEPDEATKTWALKEAYRLNGDSMVGWGSTDLSGGPPPEAGDSAVCIQIDGAAIGQQFFECRQPGKTVRIPTARPIKTVPIMPVENPRDKNAIDASADTAPIIPRHVGRSVERDICTHHHLRKVYTADGGSWRCRK